jgi:hypothetical protein
LLKEHNRQVQAKLKLWVEQCSLLRWARLHRLVSQGQDVELVLQQECRLEFVHRWVLQECRVPQVSEAPLLQA